MANLRNVRHRLQIATAVLVVINIVALGALVYMMVRGNNAQTAEFQSLRQQVQNRKTTVIPPQSVDDRVKEAQEQIAHFYEDRFPNSSAAIFEDLGKLANENHVKLNNATYAVSDADLPGLRQVAITANLNGDYVQAMKFINSLEREKTFFIVDNVSLGEQNGGTVRLAIKIETYMRGVS